MYLNNTLFRSRSYYDLCLVFINFWFWLSILYYSFTIFVLFFVLEILTTLTFLLLITSIIGHSMYFPINVNLIKSTWSFYQYLTYLSSLIYFFWISLFTSILLYYLTFYFIIYYLTFDWFLLEWVFWSLTIEFDYNQILTLGVVWVGFIILILVKLGLAPFYLWKPIFFKGLPLSTLLFYICFYYFFFLIFFLNFFKFYFIELIVYFWYWILIILILGIFSLYLLLVDIYYFKSFLALSSILNTLLVFLVLPTDLLTIDFRI